MVSNWFGLVVQLPTSRLTQLPSTKTHRGVGVPQSCAGSGSRQRGSGATGVTQCPLLLSQLSSHSQSLLHAQLSAATQTPGQLDILYSK
jgi:hypothetical protein